MVIEGEKGRVGGKDWTIAGTDIRRRWTGEGDGRRDKEVRETTIGKRGNDTVRVRIGMV